MTTDRRRWVQLKGGAAYGIPDTGFYVKEATYPVDGEPPDMIVIRNVKGVDVHFIQIAAQPTNRHYTYVCHEPYVEVHIPLDEVFSSWQVAVWESRERTPVVERRDGEAFSDWAARIYAARDAMNKEEK